MKNLKKLIVPVIGFTTVASIAVVGAIIFNSSGINKVSADDKNKLDSSIVSTAIQYCGHTSDNSGEHIKVKNGNGGYDDVGSAAITQHLNFRYEIYDNKKNSYGGNTLRIWFGRNSESNVYNESDAIIDGLEDVKFKLYSIDDPYHIIVNYSDILGQVFDVRNPLYIDLNSENTSHINDSVPQSIKFKFSLESDSFGCVSQTKFDEYTAALDTDNANGNTNAQDDFFNKYPTIDRNKKLYTYGIGSADTNDGYEIVIPNLLAGGLKKVKNPQYYTMCKALRGEGNDDGNGGNYIDTAVYKNHKAENVGDYLEFFKYCNQEDVSATLDDADVKKLIESAITFVNLMNTESSAGNYSTDYFNFEQVRKEAIQKGNGYKIDNNGKWLSISNCFDGNGNFNIDLCNIGSEEKNKFSLKCKYVAKDTYSTNRKAGSFVDSFDQLRQTIKNADGSYSYNLKANTEHYYAYSVEDVPGQEYLYHYTGTGNITYTDSKNNTIFTRNTGDGIDVGKEPSGSCKKTCEETVEVNYGPPIASSAGLCFEYEVEVISKVRCSTSTKDIKPPAEKQMCNPIPICNNIPGYIHQAGPLEDYENCIDSCDGGKYTKSCSEKCYNKVYGKSSNASKTASKEYGNNILRKVAYAETGANRYEHAGQNGNTLSFKGYYTRKKVNGIYHIYWVSTSNILSNTYSRYYRDDPNEYAKLWNDDRNSGGIRDRVNALYFPDNGFKRADYWGSTCGDYCYFSGCRQDDLYLNQDELNADAKRNYEIYESVIASCKAAASCESKTANFKISVDYTTVTKSSDNKNCNKKVGTINFPVGSNDKLVSSDNEDSNACSGTSYLDNNKKSVILDYNGCYRNCGKDSWYYTKWSFPGTWLYPKKGKIEWKDMSGTSGWKYEPNKFCLPLNIDDTNEEYWKYYQAHLDEKDVPSYKNGNPYAKNYSKLSDTFDPFDSSDSTKGKANIHASAENFGKFGWNLNIDCFYSTYNENADADNDTCENDMQASLRVKTVDLTDLFPSKDGTESTDTSKYSTDIDSVPFNWTDKASTTKTQIPGVYATPEEYGKYVQSKGYDIYNDAELEYQFHLTPSVMREFKNDSSCMNASTVEDNVVSSTSAGGGSAIKSTVITYKSACFRDGGKLVSSAKKLPNTGLLGCNNINNGKCVTAFSSLG